MSEVAPFWATEQLALRRSLEDWIGLEIDRYEREGFAGLFGGLNGHKLDEAGGYTRSFVSAYVVPHACSPLSNAGCAIRDVGVRRIVPAATTRLVLSAPPPTPLPAITLAPGEMRNLAL